MKRKLNLFLILMVSFGLILSVSAIGCGGDDEADGDVTDGDTDDVVTTDGDEDDIVDVDDNVVDGDETEVPSELEDETGCNPACDGTAGMVCVDDSCVAMTGTACTTDADCASGQTCADKQAGQDCKICLPPCSETDTTCPAGYECITAASMCYPTATFQGCPEVPLRNVECTSTNSGADCPVDTQCLTNPSLDGSTYTWGWCAAQCTTDADCVQNSTFEEACVNIGVNVCLAHCNTDADCPENIDCMDPFGFGFNVCAHQSVFFENGTLAAGETCGGSSSESCAFGNMCLGNPTMGYHCLTACDDHHDMFNCSDNQYCQHLGSESGDYSFGYCEDCGDQAPGDECTFGDMFADAGACTCPDGVGTPCLGIHPDNIDPDQREACTTADDCSAQFDPHPACVAASDGSGSFCGSSACSPVCDENASCAYLTSDTYDFQDITTQQGGCYCYPVFKGTQEAGQACAFGNINVDAGNCVSGSSCLGIDSASATNPDACNTADDCDVDQYTTGIECIESTDPAGKFCASSFCAPECNADDNCDDVTDTNFNWVPGQVTIDTQGNTACFCLPQVIGEQAAGETCTMGEFNADSGNCAAGLSCIGGVSENTCTTAADCGTEGANADCANYTPDGGTQALYCGMTMCSKNCEADADCTADFGEGSCCATGTDANWCYPPSYCTAE